MIHSLAQKLDILKEQISHSMLEWMAQGEPAALYEPMRYAVSAGGKRLRPILLQLACESVGGHTAQALDAAVALEMVHNFTLVHDDIMDHDDLRRGRQTLHKRWDESTAILAGDGLLVLAYLALSRVKIPNPQEVWRRFSLGILKVCEGQALDKAYEQRDDLSLDDYLEMIDKKTAELFAMASEVGAIIGGGRGDQVTAMRRYGATLGRAFQIQDDLLDIVADEGELGKTIGSDLKEGKKTFLMVHALNRPDEELVRRLRERLNRNPITAEDVLAVRELLVQTGTLKAARDEIERALARARETLQPIPDNAAKNHLIQLLQLVAARRS